MGQALFAITLEAMKSETDEVALQGIEFWSNVCDEEVDLQIEASEAAEEGRPPEHVSRWVTTSSIVADFFVSRIRLFSSRIQIISIPDPNYFHPGPRIRINLSMVARKIGF